MVFTADARGFEDSGGRIVVCVDVLSALSHLALLAYSWQQALAIPQWFGGLRSSPNMAVIPGSARLRFLSHSAATQAYLNMAHRQELVKYICFERAKGARVAGSHVRRLVAGT